MKIHTYKLLRCRAAHAKGLRSASVGAERVPLGTQHLLPHVYIHLRIGDLDSFRIESELDFL